MPELRPTFDYFDRQVAASLTALEALLRSPAPDGHHRARENAQLLLGHLKKVQRLSRQVRRRGMRYQESLILFHYGTELFSWRFQLNPPFSLPRTLGIIRDNLVNGLASLRNGEVPRLNSSDLTWALQQRDFFVLPIHYNPEPRGLMHLAGAPFRVVQIIPEPVTADGREMTPGAFFGHDLAHAILGLRNMEGEIGRSGLSVDAYFGRENELARALEERLERVEEDDLRRVLRASLVTAFQDGGLSVGTTAERAGDHLTIVIPEEQGGPVNRRLERRARQWLRANVGSLVAE